MNDICRDRATDPVQLATTSRLSLESTERTTSAVNEHLANLATLEAADFQLDEKAFPRCSSNTSTMW